MHRSECDCDCTPDLEVTRPEVRGLEPSVSEQEVRFASLVILTFLIGTTIGEGSTTCLALIATFILSISEAPSSSVTLRLIR